MVNITFVDADGAKTTLSGNVGDTVMQTATANGVDGIVGQCGGSMVCATCHCHVGTEWADKVGARVDGEDDMLECTVAEVTVTSRLSCQILLTPALDGLVVHLPDAQI